MGEIRLGWIIAIFVIIIVAVVGLNSFTIVNAGERGILVTLGQVQEVNLSEGIHFKAPFIQNIIPIDVKTQKIEAGASAASKDLQIVTASVALNYKLKGGSVWALWKEIGPLYRERVIDPAIQESVKSATAKFTAEELITQRPLVKLAIEQALRDRLSDMHINVQNLSITNFEFSEKFNEAIEAKVTAEQDALKAQRDLDRIKVEKQQTITQAEAANEAVKLQADAQAYKVLTEAKAEAEALRLIREQLKQQSELIDYKTIEKWDGRVPIINGSGSLPIIDIQALLE
jgi:regulator of protease activity HflC (stomatin/prohibitin superfamily)